jgi:hypothetical protein
MPLDILFEVCHFLLFSILSNLTRRSRFLDFLPQKTWSLCPVPANHFGKCCYLAMLLPSGRLLVRASLVQPAPMTSPKPVGPYCCLVDQIVRFVFNLRCCLLALIFSFNKQCGATGIHRIDFALRRRVCTSCLKQKSERSYILILTHLLIPFTVLSTHQGFPDNFLTSMPQSWTSYLTQIVAYFLPVFLTITDMPY